MKIKLVSTTNFPGTLTGLNFPKGGGPGPKSTMVKSTLWYWSKKPNILAIQAKMKLYILAWDKQTSDCKSPKNKESFYYSQ